jgi:alkanesulfonate monooxygenase SsuD/methylene tetrahydromethanopterin reductase-like flavin-dependent oxidoreductase (luciferase family)
VVEIAVQTREMTFAAYTAAARWAEEAGLAAFAVPDHYLAGSGDVSVPAHDALTVLAGLAPAAPSLELVSLVSPITFRHPAVLAKAAATLQEITGNRFWLGVGTGWMEQEHEVFGLPFPERPERFSMLEEALAYLRAAFGDPPRVFAGAHYEFDGSPVEPRPPLRLVVGGTGAEHTPRLAGEFCDEYNIVLAPDGSIAERIERARSAAAAVGRDAAEIRMSCATVALTGETAGAYRSALERAAGLIGADADEWDESLRARGAPVGTFEEVAAGIARLEDAGVERVYFQAVGGMDPGGLGPLVAALQPSPDDHPPHTN